MIDVHFPSFIAILFEIIQASFFAPFISLCLIEEMLEFFKHQFPRISLVCKIEKYLSHVPSKPKGSIKPLKGIKIDQAVLAQTRVFKSTFEFRYTQSYIEQFENI